MSALFKPFRIGSLEIRNRFMRSATTSAWSNERGIVNSEIIELYRRLSEGGVGLIVKGHLYVMDSGKAHKGMAGISHDFHVPKLKELTDTVHEHGGSIAAQLNHAGYNHAPDRAGPSEYGGTGWRSRAMSIDEIQTVIEAFGDAADRAFQAGFDGVQIHGAHGYLVSQFLSREANTRSDEWGGSLENRMRLLREIYGEIRGRLGKGVPVLIKINCDDFSPEGFTIEDSVKVAKALARWGIDLMEVSGGGMGRQQALRSRAGSDDPRLIEADFAGYAAKIRGTTGSTQTALVSGIRSIPCMEAILDLGIADVVSMSRPFIREPNLVKKLWEGQGSVKCTTCGLCQTDDAFSKTMLRCHQN
ncbi:MAG TPA: NADH:flavin oxidoreductase [Patescibacteria group bacterium]|nr:NADH:flavin oxidoreductase [Patescibacteria group bacterium]